MRCRAVLALLLVGASIWGCAGQKASEPDPNTVKEILDLKARYVKEDEALRPIGAVRLLERAIELMEDVVGSDSGRMADVLLLLGKTYRKMDDYDKALAAIEKAQVILTQPGFARSPMRGKAMIEQAVVLSAVGRHDEAINKAREGVDILKLSTGEGSPDVHRALYYQAMILKDAGQHARAVECLSASLQVVQRDEGADSHEFARTLHSLAEIHADAKQFERAEALHRQALEIRQRTLGDGVETAHSLQRFAVFQHERGEHARALEMLKSAVAMLEPSGPSKELASVMTDLGVVQLALGQDAEQSLMRSVEMFESTIGRSAFPIVDALIARAKNAQKQGEPRQANRFFEQAVKIQQEAFGPTSLRVEYVLVEQARVQMERGDLASARASIEKAAKLIDGISLPPSRKRELLEIKRRLAQLRASHENAASD